MIKTNKVNNISIAEYSEEYFLFVYFVVTFMIQDTVQHLISIEL